MWPFDKKIVLTAELREGKVNIIFQVKGMFFNQWTSTLPEKDELDRRMMLAMMGEMYHLMGPNGLAQMYREVLEQHGRTPSTTAR